MKAIKEFIKSLNHFFMDFIKNIIKKNLLIIKEINLSPKKTEFKKDF